jgi:multicomponent Na+:H+ antiporter subunit E
MYLLLYLLWILLNGRVTAEILALGIPVAGLIYGYLALGCRPAGDLLLLKRLGHVLVFLVLVAWEVVKANVAIIRIVLSPHMEITPCLVPVKTDLKSAGARAALANAITLTPGTITVDVEDDVLWVHALTEQMAEGLKDWHVARQLARIEEIK